MVLAVDVGGLILPLSLGLSCATLVCAASAKANVMMRR
jgi:hypothetical protein